MANELKRLFLKVMFAMFSILLLVGFYGFIKENRYIYWGVIISSILILLSGITAIFWIKLCKFCAPIFIRTLIKVSNNLSPIVNYLNNTRIIGPILSWCVKVTFFFWFIVLLLGDALIRVILSRATGIHKESGFHYSPVNASDINFQPLGLFENGEELGMNKRLYGDFFPHYNKKLALSLAMASKLAYEDVPIIQSELEKSGYDMNSFKPIAYRNVCGYIAEKDDNIILVFRGSNPLNIQNCLTDIRALLCKIESSTRGPMGLVHEGFYEALGEDLNESPPESQATIELSNASLVKTFETIFGALKTVMFFALQSMVTHIHDPVDHRYLGEDARFISAYSQATRWITKLCKEAEEDNEQEKNNDPGNERSNDVRQRKSKKCLYITGHSLGGGLATVFLAKLFQHNSPLLNNFSGIYTYGQPNIGDNDFAKIFGPEIGKKMFHHAYNNDVVTRVPMWAPYSNPPGNLVYMDASFSIYIYPPDPVTNLPIPVRKISYLHLSGILNLNVIRRMKNESWLRIFLRIMFPFFINDHFPGDYARAIREGTIERVIVGLPGQVGGFEK
ncbi:6361_t:CDS:2, partial [Funneliformis mosseae]